MKFWRCLREGYTARAHALSERHGAEGAYSRCRLRANEARVQGDASGQNRRRKIAGSNERRRRSPRVRKHVRSHQRSVNMKTVLDDQRAIAEA